MKSIKEAYRRYIDTCSGLEAYNSFKRILYSEADSLVQTLNNVVLQRLPSVQKEIVSVCDIGGGDGRRIHQILTYLSGKFHNRFELDFVEQSSACVAAFRQAPAGESAPRVFHGLFEDMRLRGGYDLVLLIHSIFAFEGGSAIDRVLSLPSRGGAIVLASNAANGFLGGLKRLVDEGYEDRRYEVDDLVEDLRQRNVQHCTSSFRTHWGVQTLDLPKFRQVLLDWISLGTHTSFDQNKVNRIDRYLENASVLSGRLAVFTEEEVVITIAAQK